MRRVTDARMWRPSRRHRSGDSTINSTEDRSRNESRPPNGPQSIESRSSRPRIFYARRRHGQYRREIADKGASSRRHNRLMKPGPCAALLSRAASVIMPGASGESARVARRRIMRYMTPIPITLMICLRGDHLANNRQSAARIMRHDRA